MAFGPENANHPAIGEPSPASGGFGPPCSVTMPPAADKATIAINIKQMVRAWKGRARCLALAHGLAVGCLYGAVHQHQLFVQYGFYSLIAHMQFFVILPCIFQVFLPPQHFKLRGNV